MNVLKDVYWMSLRVVPEHANISTASYCKSLDTNVLHVWNCYECTELYEDT